MSERAIIGKKPPKNVSLPDLKYKHTFKDYPKFLFEGDTIDLSIYYGCSSKEMEYVQGFEFDPANLADPLYSVGLGAFLATEFGGRLRKRPKHFPKAFLSLNALYDIPKNVKLCPASIEKGTLNYAQVRGDFEHHNILLVGSGNVNPLTALVQKAYGEQLPIRFDTPTSKAKIESSLSGKSYSRELGKYALLMMVPNPWNQKKTAILCVGTDRWGTQAAMLALSQSKIPNNTHKTGIPAKIVEAVIDTNGSYKHAVDFKFLE